jgi:hypothetical protein
MPGGLQQRQMWRGGGATGSEKTREGDLRAQVLSLLALLVQILTPELLAVLVRKYKY